MTFPSFPTDWGVKIFWRWAKLPRAWQRGKYRWGRNPARLTWTNRRYGQPHRGGETADRRQLPERWNYSTVAANLTADRIPQIWMPYR